MRHHTDRAGTEASAPAETVGGQRLRTSPVPPPHLEQGRYLQTEGGELHVQTDQPGSLSTPNWKKRQRIAELERRLMEAILADPELRAAWDREMERRLDKEIAQRG